MIDASVIQAVLVMAAFVTRTAALVLLVLLYRFFAKAQGPMVQPFKHMFWTFCFLLTWVETASVAELVGYISNAHALVEYGVNWIFVPNLVITVSLGRLLWRLHAHGVSHGRRHP